MEHQTLIMIPILDKEVVMRMQYQGTDQSSARSMTYNGIIAARRKSVPPMVLRKEIAEFKAAKEQKGIIPVTIIQPDE